MEVRLSVYDYVCDYMAMSMTIIMSMAAYCVAVD